LDKCGYLLAESVAAKNGAGMGLLVISHNEETFDALAGADQTYYLPAVAECRSRCTGLLTKPATFTL